MSSPWRRSLVNRLRQNDTVAGSSRRLRAISRFDRPTAAPRRIRALRRTRGGVPRCVIQRRRHAHSSVVSVIGGARRTGPESLCVLIGPMAARPALPTGARTHRVRSGGRLGKRGELGRGTIVTPAASVRKERFSETIVADQAQAPRARSAHPKVDDELRTRGADRLLLRRVRRPPTGAVRTDPKVDTRVS